MRQLTLLAALPFIAGCLGLAKDYPDRHLHSISAERPGEAAAPTKGLVLAVKPFSIASRYEKAEFVYRKSETEWETDYYNAFFVGPKDMLTDATASWLSRSGVFQHVGSLSGTVPPTHVLEGHVSQLWVDTRTSPPTAVIAMDFLLADDRESPTRIVLTKSWTESTPLAKDSPEEAVRGWGVGLGKILSALETELEGAIGAR